MRKDDYLPAWTEFNVADESVPQILGTEFENLDEASKFINNQAVALHHSITVQRHMDNYEKGQVRDRYREVLEDILPKLEREHAVLFSELNDAKRREKEASEMVSASITEAKLLAKEAKVGLKEMKLEELSTFRIPYNGKYYFYTFIDKHLKLCAVREISETEKRELWTAGVDNSKLFNNSSDTGNEMELEQAYLNGEMSPGDFAQKSMGISNELKDFLNDGEVTTQEGQEE